MKSNYGTKEIGMSVADFPASNDHTGRLTYRLTNGIHVSVIPDAARPLRWELLAEVARRVPVVMDGLGGDGLAGGLTTTEAEALLERLAALVPGGEPGRGKSPIPVAAQ